MTNQPPASRNKAVEAVKQVEQIKNNVIAQGSRIPGGAAQGVLKTVGAIPMAVEAFDAMKDSRLDPVARNENTAAVRASGEIYTQAQLIDAREAGHISQQQYDNTINEWRAGGNPFDVAVNASYTTAPAARPITEGISKANAAIENWTNSWVPAPETNVAQFVATAADALGEAIPGVAASVATGGLSTASVLAGTTAGHAIGALNAVGTELVEGSGDFGRAVLAGATEWASEAIGGATFNKAAGAITSKAGSLVVDAIGEGIEEVIGSGIQSLVTGDAYSLADAAYEFGIGAVVGSALGGGTNAVNAVNAGNITAQVENAENAPIAAAANADIADVSALIDSAGASTANAVVANDSLVALQRQVANPINEIRTENNISPATAERFGLVPASEGARGTPVEIAVRSYESIVDPLARGLSAPDVSSIDRAAVNPNDVETTNPRALYQFDQNGEIFLRPGTDTSGDNMFTYRGQANQFYRTSQEAGAIPASGAGMSNEGSGVYSALDTNSSDLYGPTTKLADNPYKNVGVPQPAVLSDAPIGVILQQAQNLNETQSPLERKTQSAQKAEFAAGSADVVPQNERRVRYSPSGALITEVINNPADISAAGLIFGRTTVADATPIQYATSGDSAPQAVPQSAPEVGAGAGVYSALDAYSTDLYGPTGAVASEAASEVAAETTEAETATESTAGQYVVPELISTEAVSNAPVGVERQGAERTATAELSATPEAARASAPAEQAATESTSAPQASAEPLSTESETATSVNVSSAAEENTSTAAVTATTTAERTPTANTPNPEHSATEGATPAELSPEERAAQIWTPLQARTKAAQATVELERKRERRDQVPQGNPDLVIGQGARGAIYESQGYTATFGLSAG